MHLILIVVSWCLNYSMFQMYSNAISDEVFHNRWLVEGFPSVIKNVKFVSPIGRIYFNEVYIVLLLYMGFNYYYSMFFVCNLSVHQVPIP